jgi:uncharacterized protein involved in exopolysaccharide biosynthesis
MDRQLEIPAGSQEITLAELRDAAVSLKWTIATFICVCTVLAGTLGWMRPKQYTVHVILAGTSTDSEGGHFGALADAASSLGGLASLAGLSSPGEQQKWESITVLESEDLTQNFIQQNNLLPVLYAKKWDANRNRWRDTDPQRIPTLWQANQYFKGKIRNVTVDDKSGLVTLTITWRNPVQAAAWANGLVKMTNDYLRTKAIDRSERSIAFLNEEAAKTTVVEARQAIYSVLESEIDKAMLARGTEEYAFKVLDPAFPPERPSSLAASVWVFLTFVATSLLAFLAVFVHVAWNKD